MSKVKAPVWLTIVAVIAFLWNLMGIMPFFTQLMMTPEMMAEMPEAERTLYEAIPVWNTIAFGIAVFGGALGSLLLILKKKLSVAILLLSLVGIIVQMAYNLTSGVLDVYGPGALAMPVIILVIGVVMYLIARNAAKKNWLH